MTTRIVETLARLSPDALVFWFAVILIVALTSGAAG